MSSRTDYDPEEIPEECRWSNEHGEGGLIQRLCLVLDPIAEYHVEIHHWKESTAATDRTYDKFKQTVIARGKQLARHAARNTRTARQHQQLPPEVPLTV